MPRLRVGVIGVGHLGKEHARILAGLPEAELVGVADVNAAQAAAVAGRWGVPAFSDHRDLLPLVQAAVVAVPTNQHHAVALDFLNRGIPLLVEKPLADHPDRARELADLARLQGVLLQVGHIERFNPAYEELRGLPLQPKWIQCERYGGFSGRSTDTGVVLDLMIHDLDLVLDLVRAPVRTVDALGMALLGGHEDMAQARLTFANGCVAQLTSSRLHPVAVRRLHVLGPEGFAALDFARRHLTLVQPDARLRGRPLESTRLDPATLASLKTELFGKHLQVRERDCSAGADQLTRELQDFIACVRTETPPRVDGEAGCAALDLAGRILERIRDHAWQGEAPGPVGPRHWPDPLGQLFSSPDTRAAA